MDSEKLLKTIEYYLSSLKSDSDKLSQFYSACIIAREALLQVKIDKRDFGIIKHQSDELLEALQNATELLTYLATIVPDGKVKETVNNCIVVGNSAINKTLNI
jgi:hypothetical protein